MRILRLEPVIKDAVWGGNALNQFGYKQAGECAGECWGISAHKNGDCKIIGGKFAGEYLSECYKNNREIFGGIGNEEFPLLIKIIGASEDLSIQVHPDDEYAAANENGALGKTECWYILDCAEDATIVIGHNAKDKQQLSAMIKEGKWTELISERFIKPGDFFFIEPGCLHAIKGGTLLIETQQSSDVTYRVYDYDRLSDGVKRPLHVSQSIDCINAPHKDCEKEPKVEKLENIEITRYAECEYFVVEKWAVNGSHSFVQDKPFMNVSIIKGEGYLDGEAIKKGQHLIITSKAGKCTIEGNVTAMISYVPM